MSTPTDVLRKITVEKTEKSRELFGQTYASPEHYIQYRELIDEESNSLSGKGTLVIGVSFRDPARRLLMLNEYTIKPKRGIPFDNFEDFVKIARLYLAEDLWKYVDEGDLDNPISIPNTIIKLYRDSIIEGKITYIATYLVPAFYRGEDPLFAIIAMHLLLDMLIKFAEKLKSSNEFRGMTGFVVFEKKIIVGGIHGHESKEENDEMYTKISISRDLLKGLKYEGIKAIVGKREIIQKLVVERPSLIAFKEVRDQLIQENVI